MRNIFKYKTLSRRFIRIERYDQIILLDVADEA